MVFFSSTDIKMGLRLGLDMSKTVFFSSTGIRMGLRLGLDMVLGVVLGVLYVRRRRYFGNVFFILTPNRASY